MAIREDLVSSAVNFLQDPNVATAPLEKRVAFLQSKNLTQEEIDASLSRAGEPSVGTRPISPQGGYGYQQQQPTRPQSSAYGYGSIPGEYWQQPPPEVPRRDWRDYFIMATVMSGLSYGLYFCAKRYIVPLIAPPTPPQLEQDKSAIDESFTRAFALIDQLATDTAAIKASEESRKEHMDSALAEVESVAREMKNSTQRRDEDSRRISDEVKALQALIPKALKAQEENNEARLRELTTELKGLKTLVANRMTREPSSRPTTTASGANMFGPQGTASTNGSSLSATDGTGSSGGAGVGTQDMGASTPDRSNTSSPYSPYARLAGNRAGIPAWQMAAAKKTESQAPATSTSISGTVSEVDGASGATDA